MQKKTAGDDETVDFYGALSNFNTEL